MRKFDFELRLTKYNWTWFFKLRFNRLELEYDEGLLTFHKGFGRGSKRFTWGKRREYISCDTK